jgi:hypothetical protein
VHPIVTKSGAQLYVVDGSVSAQGPNYALAKRLQHWRAVVSRSNGHTVSSNVAPSTATRSVVHNAQFAAAYGGMHHMRPMEVGLLCVCVCVPCIDCGTLWFVCVCVCVCVR